MVPAFKPVFKPAFKLAFKLAFKPTFKMVLKPTFKPVFKPVSKPAFKPPFHSSGGALAWGQDGGQAKTRGLSLAAPQGSAVPAWLTCRAPRRVLALAGGGFFRAGDFLGRGFCAAGPAGGVSPVSLTVQGCMGLLKNKSPVWQEARGWGRAGRLRGWEPGWVVNGSAARWKQLRADICPSVWA